MFNEKHIVLAKIEYLQNELKKLEDYFYVPETYQFLTQQLDAQEVILKGIEVQEQFTTIEMEALDNYDIDQN